MTEWPFDPAAVAAGAIDDDQHAAVADVLRRDPAFAAEVADYQRLVAQLESLPGVAWDPIPPPPIDMVAITRTTPAAVDAPQPPASHRTRRFLLAAAAVVVLVVAAVAVRTIVQRDDVTAARTVQLAPLADEPPTVEAQVSLPVGRSDEVRVRIAGGTPTPDGFVEELWLMNSATDLISLGTFRIAADGTANATFTTAADVGAFDYVDASREPNDGNPEHSGTSILRSAPLR
jgi:anti-sigma-K factor RskA